MSRVILAFVCGLVVVLPSMASANGGKPKSQSHYIALRPVALTIVRPTGRRGALTVEVGLDTPNPGLRERAAASGPLLRDAYIAALQPYAMRLGPGAPPDVGFIGMTLQRQTDRVLGAKGARVLLGAVLVN